MTVRTYSVKDKTGKNDKYFKLFVSVASISTCERRAARKPPFELIEEGLGGVLD